MRQQLHPACPSTLSLASCSARQTTAAVRRNASTHVSLYFLTYPVFNSETSTTTACRGSSQFHGLRSQYSATSAYCTLACTASLSCHTLPFHCLSTAFPLYMPTFHRRSLANIGLYGSLPPEWGDAGAFPSMRLLSLANNNITGTLPSEWGSVSTDSWPQLQAMLLFNNSLQGFVPSSWMSFGNQLTYTYVSSVLHQ